MWKKGLTKYVTKVNSSNFRVQATRFNIPSGDILLVNCYFPCDARNDKADDSELIQLLGDIRSIVLSSNCQKVILAGDLNAHFERQTAFTMMVAASLDDLHLITLWQNVDNNPNHLINTVDYTYLKAVNGIISTSTLDHFCLSPNLYNAVKEAGVLHDADNLSNHSPIYLKINLGDVNFQHYEPVSERMVNWSNATEDAKLNYKNTLSDYLTRTPIPDCANCDDFHCNIHYDLIEDYTIEILQAVEMSSMECLPFVGGKKCKKNKGSVPGWSEHVKPYAEENRFWSYQWKAFGKPTSGLVYENMRYSRKQYTYAVRRLKNCNNIIQNDRFLGSLVQGGCDIFKEIKRYRGKPNSISSRIDDEVGPKDISNHFANIYKTLYNRVDNGTKLECISNKVMSGIDDTCTKQLDRINEALVQQALLKLKSNKRDALFNTVSDCYINGPPELIQHLTVLIKMFLVHGFVPPSILVCTLMPLVKDKFGDTTASNNYRAIAGGCLILKLLDLVVLILEGEKLSFSEMQFAYQSNVSTTVCSWAVQSVIEHFNRNGTAVYAAAMDMSKAFDMVEWSTLFEALLKRKVHSIYLRLLLFIYQNQSCQVKWGGELSSCFSVSNGVRQGAISSAILFSVYIDDLIHILKESKIGCYIDGLFMGVFIFADDIILLSASRLGLQSMVNTCAKFASERNLTFGTNPIPEKSKTKCIVFSRKQNDLKNLPNITLCGFELPWVNKIDYLGCILESDYSMKTDVSVKRGKFIGKINSILQEFHFAKEEVLLKLLNIYTTSFYGSIMWDPLSSECDRIYRGWNVAIRNILNLDRQTHRYFVEPLSKCLHPKIMLISRMVGFYQTQLLSPKFCVRYLVKLAENDFRTSIGRTLHYAAVRCGTQFDKLTPSLVKRKLQYMETPADEKWRVEFAHELLMVRKRELELTGFLQEEIEEILKNVCIT